MKRALTLLLGLALCLSATAATADRGGFEIENFHTEIEVLENAEILVTERIEVRFDEPRHGLYRTIPVRYTDPRGFSYELSLRLLSVTDDSGREHSVKVRNEGQYVNVRMGEAGSTVVGRVVYNLRYKVRYALGHFGDFDEIYWNAVGHEFQAPILAASASVRLPASLSRDDLQVSAYMGRGGSRSQEVTVEFPEPGVVWFESPRSLAPLEGLTVSVAWPKGHVATPGFFDKLLRFLLANMILIVPVLALVWLRRRYLLYGKDPKGRESIVVRYEPPPGATPGEVGTVVDERVDLKDITATLVDLAIRGFLAIRVEERKALFGLIDTEEIVFERRPVDQSELRLHERRVLDGVFDSGDLVEMADLKEEFYQEIPGIHDALHERMVDKGYFVDRPPKVRQRYALGGVAVGIVTFLLGLLLVWLRGGVFPHAVVVPIVAAVSTAVLFMVFAPAMPQRTRKGVELRAWALGFEEFVDRVESDTLEAAEQRNVFEALLPYAMALGVATSWARRFEGIYTEKGPTWFAGGNPNMGLSTTRLQSDLDTAMTQAGQAMSSAPRSSGSSGAGGGGSSGGGGGGGGGGSW